MVNDIQKSLVAYIEETIKLPRDNGEIIFKTPWESRIFAMAVLLFEKDMFPWKDFNEEFVKEIREYEETHTESDVAEMYYQLWLKTFEQVLYNKSMLTKENVNKVTSEFTSGQRNHVC